MANMMRLRSLRRITADSRHNAFTGVAWFRGALYVAFRQGDGHVCDHGRLVVMRSRDEGKHFDIVHVARGAVDTRDAHLYVAGDRLHLVGFEAHTGSGTSWTENGLNWTPWVRCEGADGWWLWRPEYFRGRHYCAGYRGPSDDIGAVAWFESDDGVRWRQLHTLWEGSDLPDECYLAFHSGGSAALLMRREHPSRTPLLLRAEPPYRDWRVTELEIPLTNPTLWFVDDDIWIAGRWYLHGTPHLGVFKIEDDRPDLYLVLPSGGDCTYMGVARHPINRHRFALSYYSGHTAPNDPAVDQWSHPDIYLADATFDAPFIERWQVSEVLPHPGRLADLPVPNPDRPGGRWVEMRCEGDDSPACGFVNATARINGRPGVIGFVADVEVGPCDRAHLHLGFDGPVRVWVNGEPVFEGVGTNPALVDAHTVPVTLRHGRNRIAVALDTNDGRACGIFARYEPVEEAMP